MDSIGGNIINSLGAGSGLNSTSLVSQLTDIEKAPKQAQIDSARESYKTQISDFGLIRSALSTLQESADFLSESSTFNSKTASFGASDAFIPVSLDENVPVGSYSFEVLGVAAAQSLSTGSTYSAASDAVGKGTLSIDFGSWDIGEPPSTFTQNSDLESLLITVDDSNNSLTGLRDAINDADAGVTASVVNDGSGYRLLITAASGLSQQLSITATEEGGSSGLADFNFNETTQNLDQLQQGKDASLKINGLAVSRSSNDIDDVLEGFSFTLAKADPGNLVSVTVTEDKAGGEQAVRDFVDTYNAFLEAIQPAVGFNEETEADGTLKRDPTAKALQQQIRNLIGSSLGGIEGGYTALTNVGVRTELDGTLSIDENDFTLAFTDNYDLVKSLFVPQTNSSSEKITVNSYRDETVPGSYEVAITREAEKGELIGAASSATLLADLAVPNTSGYFTAAASAFSATDLATQGALSGDYGFDISVDGGSAVSILLPIADYADESAIATALQSEFDSNGVEADVVHNGTAFVVTSRSSGSNSSVAISSVLENTPGEFGLAAGAATAGSGPNTTDYDFTVVVDGVTSNVLSIALGSYADEAELASHIQSLINNDSALKAVGADVDVVWNSDHFEIVSREYGSRSNVSVTAVGGSAVDLGLESGVSSSGVDVAGTFDGVAGFGSSNVLLPKLDTDPYGLSLIVEPGATASTVNFSRGFGSELSLLIDRYLESNGILEQREESLADDIDGLDDDQTRLDQRTEAYYDRLLSQFLAMERIINSLNSSGSALDNLADRLPFTAQRN